MVLRQLIKKEFDKLYSMIELLEGSIMKLLNADVRLWMVDDSEFGMLPIRCVQGGECVVQVYLGSKIISPVTQFSFFVSLDNGLELLGIDRGSALVDWEIWEPSLNGVMASAVNGTELKGTIPFHLASLRIRANGIVGDEISVCINSFGGDIAEVSTSQVCAGIVIEDVVAVSGFKPIGG